MIAALSLLVSLSCARGQFANAPAPELSADINGARSVQVFSGWPVLLRIRLIHPRLFDDSATPITLASDSGSWTTLLHLEVRDANGSTVFWPLTFLNSPASTLLLDSHNLGELVWTLSPAQTTALAAGDYTIAATWDSRAVTAPSAWKGVAHAVPLNVQVGSEPAILTTAQLEQRQRLLADYHLALGNAAEALNQIDALLLSDSNNIGGLSYQGAVLRQLGRNDEALAATRLAIGQVHARFPGASEPPRDLLAQQFELTQLLLPGRLNSVMVTNSNVALDWNTIAGEFYSVESTPDFNIWTVLATGLHADTNRMTWSTNRLENREFFRIGQ